MDTKTKVLTYLESDRTFGPGIQLYQSLPGHNRAIVAQLSRHGDNPSTREQLHYDLAKLAGISERKLNAMLKTPVVSKALTKSKKEAAATTNIETKITEVPEGYAAQKALVKKLGLEVPNQKGKTLSAALHSHFSAKKK